MRKNWTPTRVQKLPNAFSLPSRAIKNFYPQVICPRRSVALRLCRWGIGLVTFINRHVSFLDDVGGNKIRTKGCARNLHEAWDTCLVQNAVGPDPQKAASNLLAELRPEQAKLWAHSKPRDWVNETFALAEAPATGYCVRRGNSCDPVVGEVTITARYEKENIPVVREQLLKAGVRLSHVLDVALAR